MALKTGEEAPDFELRSHRGGTVTVVGLSREEERRARVSPAGIHAGVRHADVGI